MPTKKTETIRLPLYAIDFKGTRFLNFLKGDCVIEKAAKRFFKKRVGVEECVIYLKVDLHSYKHREYGISAFDRDKKKASKAKYSPDKLIRTIVLK